METRLAGKSVTNRTIVWCKNNSLYDYECKHKVWQEEERYTEQDKLA